MQSCILKKLAEEQIEDEYGQIVESFTEYTVYNVEIQPVTSEDLILTPSGTLTIGDARAWFKERLSGTVSLLDFNDPYLYTFDSDKIEVQNGEVKLKSPYPTDNPTIVKTEGEKYMAPPFGIDIVEEKPTGTDIKFIFSGDNGTTWYWWNGYYWAESDGSYSKANSSSEVINHISELPFESGIFKVKVFLHSDGSDTPILKKVLVRFGFKLEPDDRIIDSNGIEYRVDSISDYYVRNNIVLKEVYLRRIVGE